MNNRRLLASLRRDENIKNAAVQRSDRVEATQLEAMSHADSRRDAENFTERRAIDR
jgi:hypothetical protein